MKRSDAVNAIFLIEVNNDLRVALGAELVAALEESLSELLEVVDLPVQDYRDGAILIEDGLVARGEIDDPEPLDRESDALSDVDASRVRPSMLERGAHPV